jgi:glycosyltransferase involved in cell wall biosynthesis
MEVSVVCTGRLFNQEEEDLFSELGVRDRFIHYWVSSDENLFSLYHYALCFVYTSEYEGFGIPILEAYQAECPVLLNQRSCFPEIAGDAAIYFEMNSESSNIVYKLESIYKMKSEERKSLLVRQRKRLELYSWSKSSQQLVNIYNSILHL